MGQTSFIIHTCIKYRYSYDINIQCILFIQDAKGNELKSEMRIIMFRRFLKTQGAFFWDYSGMRIHGIGGNCVLLGPILIPE